MDERQSSGIARLVSMARCERAGGMHTSALGAHTYHRLELMIGTVQLVVEHNVGALVAHLVAICTA